MVERRHAALARPTSLPLLRLMLRRGCLLRVLHQGRWLSGALLARHPLWTDAMSIVVVGVRDGDYRAVPDAARAAPIFFAREEARRRGARVCDHLVTRAFVSDGLFRRKRRWETGSTTSASGRTGWLSASCATALRCGVGSAENPFLACGEAGWSGSRGERTAPLPQPALAIPGVVARYAGILCSRISTHLRAPCAPAVWRPNVQL